MLIVHECVRAALADAAAAYAPRAPEQEIVLELDPSVPVGARIKLVRDLCDVVRAYRLDDVTPLWTAVAALMNETGPSAAEARAAVFAFMTALLEGHIDTVRIMAKALARLLTRFLAASGSAADGLVRRRSQGRAGR